MTKLSIIWWAVAVTEVSINENSLDTDKKLFLQCTTVQRNFVKSSVDLNVYFRILPKIQNVFWDCRIFGYSNLTIFHNDSYPCFYRTFTIDFRT